MQHPIELLLWLAINVIIFSVIFVGPIAVIIRFAKDRWDVDKTWKATIVAATVVSVFGMLMYQG
jgi:hypothetical protein